MFCPVVGVDDVSRPKPHPEGILKIREMVPHNRVWYVGDTVDDARSARAAGVPFIGIAARQASAGTNWSRSSKPKEPSP